MCYACHCCFSLGVELEHTHHGDLSLPWYSKAIALVRKGTAAAAHTTTNTSSSSSSERDARLLRTFQKAHADARRAYGSAAVADAVTNSLQKTLVSSASGSTTNSNSAAKLRARVQGDRSSDRSAPRSRYELFFSSKMMSHTCFALVLLCTCAT
jgi:hypothetical protein